MARAFFEESFETPFKAIPFYLLMGMCIAPALVKMGTLHSRAAGRLGGFPITESRR
jgi:hypothetical protein